MIGKLFSNRLDAAERLIPILRDFTNEQTVVLAIPRGAVPMGFYIAQALHVPFDIVAVKKISYPGNPELAVGAVSLEGRVVDPEFSIRREYIDRETKRLQAQLKERIVYLRGLKPSVNLKHKTVILIDDGMATGNSMLSAVLLVKQQSPAKVIVAVPVAAQDAIAKLTTTVDEVLSLIVPSAFRAVAEYYEDFSEVSDEEVKDFLIKADQYRQTSGLQSA